MREVRKEQAISVGPPVGRRGLSVAAAATALLGAAGCEPTVRVEAPERPIEINLNVRIEQEVRIMIDRELEDAFTDNPDIF